MKYFTADTHFFHAALLGQNDFAPRLFATVDEMNQAMIDSWNARVKPRDHVYHLGDIAMHPAHQAGNPAVLAILSELHGFITFIKGNHDYSSFLQYLAANDPGNLGQSKFSFEKVGAIVKFNHYQYYLTHYPLMLGPNRNIRNLHGHIHHYSVPIADNVNVGVDAPEREFLTPPLAFGAPISENEIQIMADKKAEALARYRS
ncbi:metallophosphoesterase family protein [Enterococcus hirae]|jgi:calcineurin-like phosphoesterase family protein|nr:metallophosphoesterase family protein [Enterococcaceae bacterium]MCI1918558.1 metallophosphoesterase family protein [Enterococcaceae bacterium]MDM8212324.1 metallophosphoesterase family protein [Enterococcus hirae]